eukprot:scaffold12.g8012.t1
MIPPALAPLAYGLLNIASATGIVFANKAVFAVFKFSFTYALTLIHTVTTLFGMQGFLHLGMFEPKEVPKAKLVPLAAAYVGYIVLCNLNLNINPVGFYQITKIAVAPAVLAIEAVYYGRRASSRVVASVALVCAGVGLATVTDPEISSNLAGLAAGFGSVGATALYQIWAGVKQKELGLGSMQLLHQYVPLAALLLAVLVPVFEPMGWRDPGPATILGYHFTPGAVVAIAISSLLGLLVNLSTFLVIGATSSLTYNVVGHIKTVLILSGGVLFFGDSMPPKKLCGIAVAMCGIVWYSQQIKLEEARATAASKLALPQAMVVNGKSGALLGASFDSPNASPGGGIKSVIRSGSRSGAPAANGAPPEAAARALSPLTLSPKVPTSPPVPAEEKLKPLAKQLSLEAGARSPIRMLQRLASAARPGPSLRSTLTDWKTSLLARRAIGSSSSAHAAEEDGDGPSTSESEGPTPSTQLQGWENSGGQREEDDGPPRDGGGRGGWPARNRHRASLAPLSIHNVSRSVTRNDIASFLAEYGVDPAEVRAQYRWGDFEVERFWVNLPSIKARDRALERHASYLASGRQGKNGRGRYVLVSNLPESATSEDVLRFFPGYDLHAKSVTFIRDRKASHER